VGKICLRLCVVAVWFSQCAGVETCPRETGFCVKSNGHDQNSGVIKVPLFAHWKVHLCGHSFHESVGYQINSVQGNTALAQQNCMKVPSKHINMMHGAHPTVDQACQAHTVDKTCTESVKLYQHAGYKGWEAKFSHTGANNGYYSTAGPSPPPPPL
jgi:hypothetical protein